MDESSQSDCSDEVMEPTVPMLKKRLRKDHQQELKNFNEISDITRSIANAYNDDKNNIVVACNLNHELQLRSTIDHQVRLLHTSDSTPDIITALNDVQLRQKFFNEQLNFVNEAASYGEMAVLYPDQLLSMSFDRQKLLFNHIFKNNYPTHASGQNPITIRLLDEDESQRTDQQDFYEFERVSFDSSDSETEQLPSPSFPTLTREIVSNEAALPKPSTEQNVDAGIPNTTDTGISTNPDIDINQNAQPADQMPQQQTSQDTGNENLENITDTEAGQNISTETEGNVIYVSFHRSSAPGCSKWTKPGSS